MAQRILCALCMSFITKSTPVIRMNICTYVQSCMHKHISYTHDCAIIMNDCCYKKLRKNNNIVHTCSCPSTNIALSSPIKSEHKVLPKCVKKYQGSLKNMYNVMTPFLEEDFPDRVPREDAKVVLIQNSGYDKDNKESESLDYDHAYGKIDSIQAHKKEIDVSLILEPVPSMDKKEPPKAPKMLMDGAPGVGKTTLTLSACKDWAKNKIFKQYDLVLLVPLRQSSCREAKSLIDLLPGDDPTLKQEVVQYILKSSGENIAIVFDGYDELSYEQRRRGSFFMDIFRGKVLHKCAVWITSRPYTSGELLKIPSINRHVEILGFKKEQIYACVRKRIKDREKAYSLIQQLEEREDITSICYIPLLCIIMIRVFESNSSQPLPLTMTELFDRFLRDLLKRHVQIVESNDSDIDSDSESEESSDRLNKLECLAYKCLVEDKFVFTFKELKAVLGSDLKKSDIKAHSLGLLTASTNVGKDHEQHFQFVHLSMQEFLAARRISKSDQVDELLDIYRQYIGEPRYRLLLLFLSGMMKSSGKQHFELAFQLEWKEYASTINDKSLRNDKERSWANRFLYCTNLIFESTCFDYFTCLFHSLPNKKILDLSNHTLTLFDCRILSHFLCSVQNDWECLNLQNCSLNVDSLEVMDRAFKYQAVASSNASICQINLSGNDPEVINNLFKFPWNDTIKSLIFQASYDEFRYVSLKEDLSYLTHIPKLNIQHETRQVDTTSSTVTLRNATLGEGFTKYLKSIDALILTGVDYGLVQAVSCDPSFNSLTSLELSDIPSLDNWIGQTASKIGSSTHLRSLTLNKIGVTSIGASHLFQSLACNSSVQDLCISHNPLSSQGNEVGIALKTLLCENKTIQKLKLTNVVIDDNLLKYLIAGLTVNCTLKSLDVNENPVTVEAVCNAITATVDHISLSEFRIAGISLHANSGPEISNTSYGVHAEPENCFWRVVGTLHPNSLCILSKPDISGVVKFGVQSGVNDIFMLIHDSLQFDGTELARALQHEVRSLHFSSTKVDVGIGCAIEATLTFNNTIQSISFSHCSISESMLKYLEAGLANNLSVKELSLTHMRSKEARVILCVFHALHQNRSIENLDLSNNGTILTQCCNNLISLEVEKLLSKNCTLNVIDMCSTCINDEIAVGFAKGLRVNRCLKTLKMTLNMLTFRGVSNIVHSSTSSKLTKFKLSIYAFSRSGPSIGWELAISDEARSWPHLQEFFHDENVIISSVKMKEHQYVRCYQVERHFRLLTFSKCLKVLDLSKQSLIRNCFFEYDEVQSKDLGIALSQLLTNCCSLEKLMLKNVKFPEFTWMHAAEGLKKCSLRHLDVSGCAISAVEAVKIFNCLGNIEQLDISDNPQLMDEKYTIELSEAIKTSLSCTSESSNLKYINLTKSLSDSIAKKVAATLRDGSGLSLKIMEVYEGQLSCSAIQLFLELMYVPNCSLSELKFTKVQLIRSSREDFLSNVINKVTDALSSSNAQPNFSYKILCGVCKHILNIEGAPDVPLKNITSITLHDVDDEAAIILFRSLAHPLLSKVHKLSLHLQDDSCETATIGESLQTMLKSNVTLQDFSFNNIVVGLLTSLANGLKCNNNLKVVILGIVNFETTSIEVLAKFLNAIESSKSIAEVAIRKLPLLLRDSTWHIRKDSEAQFYYDYDISLKVWLICSLSRICNDELKCYPAITILKSCPTLRVNDTDYVDTNLLTSLFNCLKYNCTIKELDLSGNKALSKSTSYDLLKAFKSMFSENTSLEVIKLVDIIKNDDIANALVAGLKNSSIPRHVHIDAKSPKLRILSKLVDILEMGCLKSLTIVDVVLIRFCEPCNWQIKIYDRVVWSLLLTELMKVFPEVDRWNEFKHHTEIECVGKGTPIEFCEEHDGIHYRLPCRELIGVDETVTQPNSNDIKQLVNTHGIKGVGISGCSLVDDVFQVLSSGPSALSHMTKLDLSCSTRIDLHGIVEVLENVHSLKELNVSNNNLSSDDNESFQVAIKSLLKRSMTILKLNLASCSISDSVCKHIGFGMQCNTSLLFLDLSGNNITDSGATSFLHCVKCNNSLKEINLSRNNLMFEEHLVQVVCDFLTENKSVTELNLDSVNDVNNDVLTITESLQTNNCIQLLTLPYSTSGLYILKDLLLKKNLLRLNLTHTIMSSLVSTGVKGTWDVEIHGEKCISERLAKLLSFIHVHNVEMDVGKLSITCSKISELFFLIYHYNVSQMIRAITCVKPNHTLKLLQLYLGHHFTVADRNNIVTALRNLAERSLALTHLQLLGAICDVETAALIAMLRSPVCTIKRICVQVDSLSVCSVVDLLKVFDNCGLIQLDFLLKRRGHDIQFCALSLKRFRIGIPEYHQYQSGVEVGCNGINDTLSISLFQFLKVNESKIKALSLSTKLSNDDGAVSQSLEDMLTYNKTIESLDLCNTDADCDLIMKAVAKGLRKNNALQKLNVDMDKVYSDSSLSTVLTSLGSHCQPVSIKIKGSRLSLAKCVSIQLPTQTSFPDSPFGDYSDPKPSYTESKFYSRRLERVLRCSRKVQKLEISVYQAHAVVTMFNSVVHEIPTLCNTSILCDLLSTNNLKVLRVCNPLTAEVIQNIASCLKQNKSLNYLAINLKDPRLNSENILNVLVAAVRLMDNVSNADTIRRFHKLQPVILSLNSSSVKSLEIIDDFLFCRDDIGGDSKWTVKILKGGEFDTLLKFLEVAELGIDKIIASVERVKLNLCDHNDVVDVALNSIADGCFQVKELNLIFHKADSATYGMSIERMLTSRSNRHLRKLTVTELKNDAVANHTLVGLAKNTALRELEIRDSLQTGYISLVNRLRSEHFMWSHIWKISINDDVSLQRRLDQIPIQMFDPYISSSCNDSRNLPQDGSWVLVTTAEDKLSQLYLPLVNNLYIVDPALPTSDKLIFQFLKKLDFSHSSLTYQQLASLFEALKKDDVVGSLDVSYTLKYVQGAPTCQKLRMHSMLQEMLITNETLKVFNFTGHFDENIATILASELHRCSLTSLRIDFNTRKCSFEHIERLLLAFIRSNLCYLHIEDLCCIHLHRHESDSYHAIIRITTWTSRLQQQPQIHFQLLQSFTIMYILYIVSRDASEITITVDDIGCNDILPKVFQLFFNSVHCLAYESVAKYLTEHIKKWHLEFTACSKQLFDPVISALYGSSSLKEIYFYHDAVCAKDDMLSQSYVRLMSSSQSIEVISFEGVFSNQLANAVISGLAQTNEVKTIRFGVSHLTNDMLVNFFNFVYESQITCVHIMEGCDMKRMNRNLAFNAEITGDKSLLCKLYCASAYVSQKHPEFLSTDCILSSEVLDLSAGMPREIDDRISDFSDVFSTTLDGLVSCLHLTGNRNVSLNQRLLLSSTCVLEELHMGCCNITDLDCEHIGRGLATNACLKRLDLHSNDITRRGADHILRAMTTNNTLQVLDISGHDFSEGSSSVLDRSIKNKRICKNTTLLKLDLGLCGTYYLDTLTTVCAFSSLKALSLQIGKEELLIEVLDSLTSLSTLEELNISESSARTVSVMVAMNQLLEHRNIKALDLSGCGITDEACVIFAKGLEDNKQMERLNLSENETYGRGILALFKVLESNSCSLTELDISSMWSAEKYSNLGEDEIEGATVLSTNTSLKSLIVSNFPYYEFNEWFGIKLFNGLKQNTTLNALNISGNVLFVDTCNAFVNMLRSNSTLVNISVFQTEFFWCDCVNNLAEAFLQCSSLKELTVDQSTEELLHYQDKELNQKISVIRKVDHHR